MNEQNRPAVPDEEAARLKRRHTIEGFIVLGVVVALYITGVIFFFKFLPQIKGYLNELLPADQTQPEATVVIVIPEGTTEIPDGAYLGRKDILRVEIPEGVTTIGQNAFFGCTGLQSVTLPDSVTEIKDSAFNGCASLESITLPKNLRIIGSHAFSYCSKLTGIVFPDSVEKIGMSAFSSCSALTEIRLPPYLRSVESFLFSYCTGLRSVSIGGYAQEIKLQAFIGCSNLTELTVANGVKRIEHSAFQYTNLTTVSLPATITYLGYESFGDCKSLSEITFAGTTTQWNKIDKPLWKEGTPRVIVRCSNGNVLAE